jgi:hypothetical protein
MERKNPAKASTAASRTWSGQNQCFADLNIKTHRNFRILEPFREGTENDFLVLALYYPRGCCKYPKGRLSLTGFGGLTGLEQRAQEFWPLFP